MSNARFFVWYEDHPENMAKDIRAECPSRAAKDFLSGPPYGIKLTNNIINVRNTDGRLFTYTNDQLFGEQSRA